MFRRRFILWCVLVLSSAGAIQFGPKLYVHATAQLGQHLLHQSWERTLNGETHVKPWPWATISPIARLEVPRLGVDLVIFSAPTHRTVAFGPRHLDGSPLPGTMGNSIVLGRGDVHFSFLQNLRRHDEIILETPDGIWQRFRVVEVRAALRGEPLTRVTGSGPKLTLATLHPFEAAASNDRLHYVVRAERVEPLKDNRWDRMLARA